MRMKPKSVMFALVLVGALLGAWNEVERGSQYHLGMKISEIRSMTGGRYPISEFAIYYPVAPTPKQMNEDAVYYINDEDTGVLLLFNHYEVLIDKKRTKWFGINVIKTIDYLRPK